MVTVCMQDPNQPLVAQVGRYSRGPETVTSSRSVNTNPFTSAPGLGYGTGFDNFDHNPAYRGAYGNSPFTPQEQPVNDLRRRELDADFLNGSSDLTDILAHFEQVADYNGWSDAQRASFVCEIEGGKHVSFKVSQYDGDK